MRFLTFDEMKKTFAGKRVAIVGSGPGSMEHVPGFVDGHEVVLRVNNYKLTDQTGRRTDVHYSFYGNSIKKTRDQLINDGVYLCMCKCPNSQPIDCDWHRARNKMFGIDFRYIYKLRKNFWFCDTYLPTDEEFVWSYEMLGKHIPTTGFAAILDVLRSEPESIYLTGFDFFRSRMHNLNEQWSPGDPSDPIGHRPELEIQWLKNYRRRAGYNDPFLAFDTILKKIIEE